MPSGRYLFIPYLRTKSQRCQRKKWSRKNAMKRDYRPIMFATKLVWEQLTSYSHLLEQQEFSKSSDWNDKCLCVLIKRRSRRRLGFKTRLSVSTFFWIDYGFPQELEKYQLQLVCSLWCLWKSGVLLSCPFLPYGLVSPERYWTIP